MTRLQQALIELSEDVGDLEDAQLLLTIADEEEIARARRGTGLISGRGYGRDRDLATSLTRLLRDRRAPSV